MADLNRKENTYTFCYTNIMNHNLIDTVIELKNKGLLFSAESCLNHCGTCRRLAICRVNGGLVKGTAEQLAMQLKEDMEASH